MRVVNRSKLTVRREERGASIVIVLLAIVGILGMAAFVLDIGALRQERRSLQNGADAAALAVVRDCINGDCGSVAATAKTYADSNADDKKAKVDQICGWAKNGTMPACSGAVTSPSRVTGWVQAKTSTLDNAGNTQILYGFGRIFGLTGRTVDATAYTAWGPPGRVTGPPIMMADCEYQRWKSSGGADIVIKNVYDNPGCANGGGNPSGGFTWQNSGSVCTAETISSDLSGLDVAEITPQGTGNNKATRPPSGCSSTEINALKNQLVRIPIWNSSIDCGGHLQYTIVGFALFRITGIQEKTPDITWNVTKAECPDGRCLKGHFETLVETAKAKFGGNDYGILTYRYFNADDPEGNFT